MDKVGNNQENPMKLKLGIRTASLTISLQFWRYEANLSLCVFSYSLIYFFCSAQQWFFVFL